MLFNAPEFELVDQNGGVFGTNELRGHVWVVNFMFTQCKATCPQQTERIAALQRHARRWPDWARVRLVSVSVDPQHDTPQRLHEYAERHAADHAHWKFLTGGREDLWRICKDGFKLPVKDGALDGSAPITHSPQFVLIDADSRIRGYYDGLSDGDFSKLLAEMRIVLGEPAPGTEGLLHVCVPSDVFDPLCGAPHKGSSVAHSVMWRSSFLRRYFSVSPFSAPHNFGVTLWEECSASLFSPEVRLCSINSLTVPVQWRVIAQARCWKNAWPS